MSFSIGSDPEFILFDKFNNPKSAIGLLPSKIEPVVNEENCFFYDNVLAEINVKPAYTKEEFLFNTSRSLKDLSEKIKPFYLSRESSYVFPDKELGHKDARIAGCAPEWNVYTLECIMPPESVIKDTGFRTAGGHLHIGSSNLQDHNNIFNFIKMMDLFVGVPFTFLDNCNSSKKRRSIYGKAGSHRITDYGVEYRVLNNFWLFSEDYIDLIYDLTFFVYQFVLEKQYNKFWSVNESLLESETPQKAYHCFGYDNQLLCKLINNYDMRNVNKFMTFISHFLPEHIYSKILKLKI